MNIRFIILMGIIFFAPNAQAMKESEKTPMASKLAQEIAAWEKRKKSNSSANQGLDTLELEKVKKILGN